MTDEQQPASGLPRGELDDRSLSVAQFPDGIRALLADSDVKEVFGQKDEAVQLTLTTLGPILE